MRDISSTPTRFEDRIEDARGQPVQLAQETAEEHIEPAMMKLTLCRLKYLTVLYPRFTS